MMLVSCCYCSATQSVPEPPSLVDCMRCKRPFRVFRNEGQDSLMELSPAARGFYTKRLDQAG